LFYHPADDEIVAPGPLAPGMSRVVFMRPKKPGTTAPAFVIEVTRGQPFRFVGPVGISHKIAYDVTPGEHLFMVVGSQADFMSAMLEEGKTYYAEVIAQLDPDRIFVWLVFDRSVDMSARFDLRAIHKIEIETGLPDEWLDTCRWNMPNESAPDWDQQNRTLILRRFNEFRPKWTYKLEDGPPRLEPRDGFVGS